MASVLPRARTEVVAGAGHAVHLEQPDRVAAILARDAR
jgi:pimeloyl-ACP methyl ester carboxylesterase